MVSWLGTCASYDVRKISFIVYGPIPCNQARKLHPKYSLESLPVRFFCWLVEALE